MTQTPVIVPPASPSAKTEKSAAQAAAPTAPEPEALKVLLTWKAPARPHKKRHKEVYMTALSIAILVSIVLLFVKEFLLIGVIFSVYFVFWVLNNIAPDQVEHKLTNQGVTTGGINYPYHQLARFWFSDKWDQTMVHFEHVAGFPPRLILLLGDQVTKKQIQAIVSKYLPFQEAPPTLAEKAGNWLSTKIPLESEKKSTSK